MNTPARSGPTTRLPDKVFNRPVELLLYAVSPLATILTAPLLARFLGVEARGQYGVALAVVAFALTLSAWGQSETLLRDARLGLNFYRSQARLTVVGGLLATCLAGPAVVALGVPWQLALAAVVFIPAINQTWLWRSWAISRGELRLPAIYNAASALSRVVVLLAAAAIGVLNAVVAVVATQATLAAAAFGVLGYYVFRTTRSLPRPETSMGRLIRSGATVIMFDLCNALTLRSDLIILPLTSSAHQVGIYAAPASLTTAALAVSLPFKARAQSLTISGAPARRLLREMSLLLGLGGLGILVALALAGPVTRIAFGSGFDGSAPVLRLLAVSAVALVACDVAQGVLVVLPNRRDLLIVGLASACTVCACLLALTPHYGATGAAVALVIGYTASALIAWSFVTVRIREQATSPT